MKRKLDEDHFLCKLCTKCARENDTCHDIDNKYIGKFHFYKSDPKSDGILKREIKYEFKNVTFGHH